MTKGNQGFRSKNVRHTQAPKVEPRAREMRPGGVAQLGNKQGSHTTNRTASSYRGEQLRGGAGYNPPGMISDPVKAVGVGGGRTIYKTGSQDQQGQVAGSRAPQGRGILNNE